MQSLRQQFSGNVSRANKTSDAQRTSESSRSSRSRKKISVKQLENKVIERIKLLDRNNRDFSNQAKQVFVELVLVWEFGDHIRNDLLFSEMSQTVLETFNSDENFRKKMQALIDKMS